MKALWRFLGSAYLAALLISLAAAGVIIGTVIEARSSSHILASSWVYSNPCFQLLLALFFVNILVSALRRWPFRRRHLPFLITHLGLLMVLAGTLIKSYWGEQGSIYLIEGAVSHQMQIPNSMALYVKKNSPTAEEAIPLTPGQWRYTGQMPVSIKAFHPHVLESYSAWSDGNHLALEGLKPFPVIPWKKGDPLPAGITVKIEHSSTPHWRMLALKTKEIAAAAQALYHGGKINGNILDGVHLLDQPAYGQIPTIAWLQDFQEDLCLLVISEDGSVWSDLFRPDLLPSVVVYDEGFGGYAALTHLPIGEGVTLTSSLRVEQRMMPPRLKLEDNRPRVVLDIEGQELAVVYDPRGQALPLPTTDGNYLVSLAPIKKEIPHRLRLHKATQCNYPGTGQACHYEALITFEDRKTHEKTKAVLSMNEVHETWDGYRFYLAGMNPPTESSAKHVQIVVNRDPAKYFLTYPGGILVVLGIVGLLSPLKRYF